MGLVNFLEQKALLDNTKNDLENMQIYVKNINDCLQAIDTCWVGGRDKFIIENTIVSHLNEAHLATKELNGFKQTATFALMKMNELGSLNGLIAPFINPISLVNIFIDFFTNSKINIRTNELKNIADRIDRERQRLNDTKFAITKINNILDYIILNLFGLNALLKTIDRRVANLITENQRIVNAIRHICGLYENTENKIKKQIEAITGIGAAAAGVQPIDTPQPASKPGEKTGRVNNIKPVIQQWSGRNPNPAYDPSVWGDYDSISKTACGVASLSMALSSLGVDVTPIEICDNNVKHGDSGDYMHWDNFKGCTYHDVSTQGSTSDIDTALENYKNDPTKYAPPIMYFTKPDGGKHFVVVTGQTATHYITQDPGYLEQRQLDKTVSYSNVIQYTKP